MPKKDSIDLSGLDVHEEAHFEYRGIRYFAHRGLAKAYGNAVQKALGLPGKPQAN